MGSVNSGGVYLGHERGAERRERSGSIDASVGDYRRNQLRYVIEPDKAQMQAAVAGWKAADAKIEQEPERVSEGVHERDGQAGVGVCQEQVGGLQGRDGEHPDRRREWRQRGIAGGGAQQQAAV